MAQNSWPYDAGAGSSIAEQSWRYLGTGLGAFTPGVVPGFDLELDCWSNSDASRGVRVRTGRAACFGHHYENTTEATVNCATNSSGSNRLDRVVIRFDFTANSAAATVLTGSGMTPAAMTQNLTSAWDIHLAYVLVPNGATTIPGGNVFPAADRWAVGPSPVPLGGIIDFALVEGSVPYGWKLCSGGSTDSLYYPRLAAALPAYVSGRWGYDSGARLIYWPDLRGRDTRGLDNMGGSDAGRISAANNLGAGGGANALVEANLPPHAHGDGSLQAAAHQHGLPSVTTAGAGQGYLTQSAVNINWTAILAATEGPLDVSGSTGPGAGSSSEFLPPYALVNKIMRVC